MGFYQLIWILTIVNPFKASIYLYHTEDGLSVEFYDCMYHRSFIYCRRPSELIDLYRESNIWTCYHDGIRHSFESLHSKNISVHTIVYQWRSTLEMADRYARYRQQSVSTDSKQEKYLCQCTNEKSFGKFCEYLFPIGLTLEETIQKEIEIKKKKEEQVHLYTDILCYKTLECDSGLLCLDWRNICDGIQQCMFGYDEENCDFLEFNECEQNEYRCSNGMCILDEYFLDGDYDCMDLSDEKELFYDRSCMFESTNLECDERLCLADQWSCGDGQCIFNRLEFQETSHDIVTCQNRRDSFFICEGHGVDRMWTLSNGKCYEPTLLFSLQDETDLLTNIDPCYLFLRCALSDTLLQGCPCPSREFCYPYLINPCKDKFIPYPNGSIIAPYIRFLYQTKLEEFDNVPAFIQINASIKCRGYLIHYETILNYSSKFNYRDIEYQICSSQSHVSRVSSMGYNRDCHQNSRTFNQQPYHFVDICNVSRECFAAYRIRDGSIDCADQLDEKPPVSLPSTCSSLKHARFHCSMKQPSCLPVSRLGDLVSDCENKYDEFWMGIGINLAKFKCNQQLKENCQFFRHYVKMSSTLNNQSNERVNATNTIPFRAYCDTFWDVSSKDDEDRNLCGEYWKCLPNQWQCRSGQCIDPNWLLDEEWDCVDASDEQALFIGNHHLAPHNIQLNAQYDLDDAYRRLYDNKPLMTLCRSKHEMPCYRTSSYSNRFCLELEKIGDGSIDCLGGLDEQNILNDCQHVSMLGEKFQCLSSQLCIPYQSLCQIRCPNSIDDQWLCSGIKPNLNCSKNDFSCLDDGQCVPEGRCQDDIQCVHEEDQYLCPDSFVTMKQNPDKIYRREKELSIRYDYQLFQLPRFPPNPQPNKVRNRSIALKISILAPNTSSLVYYQCNRGVGVYFHNGSIVCFCPQPYYGDRCQFYQDRLTLMFHLNFSQSTSSKSTDSNLLLKFLVLFLFEEQILSSYEFHHRPALELRNSYLKNINQFVYSRAKPFLTHKQKRYFNRTSIQYEQPYSIRIESYQIEMNQKPHLIAVWQYLIYFDYLPSFRFSKVLHLFSPLTSPDPCLSQPCGKYQRCYPLQNNQSNYICLCPENYLGRSCSEFDEQCANGFCSINSLCKPTYRGIQNRNSSPYCICSRRRFGGQCHLEQDQCQPNPCFNDGQCVESVTPTRFFCICSTFHKGDRCEEEKATIRLALQQTIEHRGAVVQYFQIDYLHLNLLLDYQHPYETLPDRLFHRYNNEIAPEIILAKLYSPSNISIYLISLQINVTSINGTTQINEYNHCRDLSDQNLSPIKYHRLCIEEVRLTCFIDRYYLCICDQNHSRAECFYYEQNLDQCSGCLASGQCLRGDRSNIDDYICICPSCHSGRFCQFSSESFSFTLDQLFSSDLLSSNKPLRFFTIFYLTVGSSVVFLLGLMNNLCSLVTFRRPKCQRIGIGQYLLTMSVINQVNLCIMTLRLIHLTISITNGSFPTLVNSVLCSLFNYLLVTSSRMTYWLVSLIAIERVYTTLSLQGQWLKKPSIARRIILIMALSLLITGAYELIFVKAHSTFDRQHSSTICILEFPAHRSIWKSIHQGVTIVHSLLPLLINLCAMMIIILVVVKKKMRITEKRSVHSVLEPSVKTQNNTSSQRGTKYSHHFHLLREVVVENKEVVIGPAFTLVPQLFSLPLFIASIVLVCQTIETNSIRYLLIISYFTSFIPQFISFFLYISPSSLYSQEWQTTNMYQRFNRLRRT